MDEVWIPIIGIFCLFGLPVIGWVTVRVLQHRERMAMLQRGLIPPPNDRMFRRGAWTAPHQQAWAPMPPPPGADACSPQDRVRKGIVTASVGMALLIGLSFIGYHAGDGVLVPATFRPGPWLLGGLIPLFVGLAQIAIALLSGAQMGRFTPPPSAPTPPPPPPPGSYGGYEPPPSGRTGPRFEELARPVPPPDRP